MTDGIPYGLVVTDGVLRTSGNINSVGFFDNGAAVIGKPGLSVKLSTASGTPLDIFYNKVLTVSNGIGLYSNDYDTKTKNTVSAYNLVLQPDSQAAAELKLNGTVTARVVRIAEKTASCDIPAGCFVLSVAESSVYTSALTLMKSIALNDTLTITTATDPAWQNVLYACGGGDMNETLRLLLSGILGYLIGSVSLSIVLSNLLYHRDVRTQGSGNAGATNAARVFGLSAGVLTFLGDFLKTLLALWLGKLLAGENGILAAGALALLGHCFPVYFHFKGGKGVSCGAAIALMTKKRQILFTLVRGFVAILIALLVATLLIFISAKGEGFSAKLAATGKALQQMLIGPLFRTGRSGAAFELKRLTDIFASMAMVAGLSGPPGADSFRSCGKNRPPEGRTSRRSPPGHPGRPAAPAGTRTRGKARLPPPAVLRPDPRNGQDRSLQPVPSSPSP